jgi:predicted peroxiredoxin
MGSLLVHITHGPDAPTRAALGFLVARAALEAGHDVSLFLAGDAAVLVRAAEMNEVEGLGTGKLAEHVPAVVEAGGKIYVSGMSAKARGMDESDLEATKAEFAMPPKLVELTFGSDRVLTY